MLDVTLELTHAERGYVFLKDEEGKLRLAGGRNSKKEPCWMTRRFPHRFWKNPCGRTPNFLITDTSQSLDLAGRQSIVAYDLRTVVCIPLRKFQVQTTRAGKPPYRSGRGRSDGECFYVDSRFVRAILPAWTMTSARDCNRSGVADRERAPGAGGGSGAPLSAGVVPSAAGIQQRLMQVKDSRSALCAASPAERPL